ncbi:MAG: hypothetical protein IJ213_01790 [Bacteroidales bacterium]|nr:hypothetical protein [Bacteroidales bacterium]
MEKNKKFKIDKLYQNYSDEIFDLAKNHSNNIFFNSSEWHASIVHKALVKYAEKDLTIFCGNMLSDISNNDEYCNYMTSFLKEDKSRTVYIIFNKYSEVFLHTKIAKIFSEFPAQVKIKTYAGEVKYKGKNVHFTVVDNRAFRFETDIEKKMAFGSFNQPDTAAALKISFDKLFYSFLTKPIFL